MCITLQGCYFCLSQKEMSGRGREQERVGERERAVLITTLPRKLSHVRQEEKAPRRILKMNKRDIFKHNERKE